MKIAIPTAEGRLCLHFGHCQQFAIVEIADNKVGSVEMHTPPRHEPGVLPKWLGEMGVDVVVAGGMGQRAIQLFQAAGIQVVVGAPCETPEVLARAFADGTLDAGSNVCDH